MYVLEIEVLARAACMAFESNCAVAFDSLPPLSIAALPARTLFSYLHLLHGNTNAHTRLDCKRGDIHDDFGTCLEYNQQDSNRTRHAV